MFQKNSVYPNFFYLHSFLLLPSISLKNIQHRTTRNCWKNIKYPTKKINFTGKEFTPNESIADLAQFELSHEEWDLIKAGLCFSIQPDKIWKFEHLHFLFKRFIVHLLTTLNLRKLKVRWKRITHILLFLVSITTNSLHVSYVNISLGKY